MRPQILFAPTLHLTYAQAYARFTPARPALSRVSPSLVCSGFAAQPKRTGAPRHPPPGCLRAAGAARRALMDVSSNADGIAGIKEWGRYSLRGCSTIYATGIPYTAIGDLETYQKDTRYRGKWGQLSATDSKALVVEHSLRAKVAAIRG